MTVTAAPARTFLFLQGPHGPFFNSLGKMLRRAGAEVWRVGFNAGDRAFWFHPSTYIPYRGTVEDWPSVFATLLDEKQVTDIVLYGDTRPIHAEAVAEAKRRGITVHVFEEGYMRPYWVTYERGGSNGNSRLMEMTIPQMQAALARSDMEAPLPPGHWGDMRHHIFYGALYHWFVMFRNGDYRNFKPHRSLPVTKEFRLYLKRLLLMPVLAADRLLATLKIRLGGFPYHLALLQLEHDSSFQMHSPFDTMADFLELVIEGFAKGAPQHHHLVIKAHPLEDGRVPVRRDVKRLARAFGVSDRVHFVRGGKLAQLLNDTRSAVTVNSTAGQQVLWRGIPLKVFGRAVYSQPEFVSDQPLPDFFATASRPDNRAYKDYRRYLLETSQVPGGFYAARGRRQLLRQVVDMMLAPDDPYDALEQGTAAPRQQLRVVT
ncbi:MULTISPECIES: capsule biosynthesis protein [unclassified Sulfitobacter]|jgi:capsular polysaccharide export protein|uniref:capsule biosynthesis protein n=1 Tax=unclassified Sulfitobacter TaxID=196795 RepID=UPI0007C317FD|nr:MULTISPECIES: capsular biosynthesis protein [unclassified Sulfitobacter]KZX99426.1 capsule biosynthesis protein CapA [Sulfitobacter sp. HI0021]KZY02313.1 capsule biosynthesis protein CapA [Sulfitobacter sp. HI0027]KZZ00260.1 capsule biosynthesis protein CapA [Sulfitobacter sp. HI0076]